MEKTLFLFIGSSVLQCSVSDAIIYAEIIPTSRISYQLRSAALIALTLERIDDKTIVM